MTPAITDNAKGSVATTSKDHTTLAIIVTENAEIIGIVLANAAANIHFSEFKENLEKGKFEKVYTSSVFGAIIDLYTDDNIITIPAGTKVLRARIVKDRDDIYREKNGIHFEDKILRGYDWFNSKEPPVGVSSAGRANSRYSSYFYCADNGPTAASEIKPNIGDYISLASFTVNQELRLIRLTEKEIDGIGTMLDLYQNIIARHFTSPVSDAHDYYLTQFISDEIRKLGVDGICYQSHFTNGNNYVIFNCPMKTLTFVNSKIVQLYSQTLNFIDFSSSTVISTTEIPKPDAKKIEEDRDNIYDMIEAYKQEDASDFECDDK